MLFSDPKLNHSLRVNEGQLMTNALNAFLIFVSKKGLVYCVSEDVYDHLGLRQVCSVLCRTDYLSHTHVHIHTHHHRMPHVISHLTYLSPSYVCHMSCHYSCIVTSKQTRQHHVTSHLPISYDTGVNVVIVRVRFTTMVIMLLRCQH